jgi:antitoxin component of RelBE/YafQ-DinJ toxin-antitoxin module
MKKVEQKTKFIQIRITEKEKEEIQAVSKKGGFDGISAFLLFLFRKYGKKI